MLWRDGREPSAAWNYDRVGGSCFLWSQTTPALLSPHLIVKDADAALAFYAEAFGAKELFRLVEPSGKIGHAEMTIGDALVMLTEEYPDYDALSAASIGGSPVRFHLPVDDADAAADRAVEAGAKLIRPAQDEFYGERSATVEDPFGLRWLISQTIEDVSPEQMQRRWDEMFMG